MDYLRGLQVSKAPYKKPLPAIYPIVKLQKKDISIVPGKYYFPDENRGHDYTYSDYGPPDAQLWKQQFNNTQLIMDSFNPVNYNVPCYHNVDNSELSDYVYSGGKSYIPGTEEIFINEIFTIPANEYQTPVQATRY
jgi:hypothetical protein